MNHTKFFYIAARIEDAHTSTQDWIKNDAPELEERLTEVFFNVVSQIAHLSLFLYQTASEHYSRRLEYKLQVQLAYIRLKRFYVQRQIAHHKALIETGIDQKVEVVKDTAINIWSRKADITVATMDTLFCLN